MAARILQFPRKRQDPLELAAMLRDRSLALGVIESMTFCTGHPPRPAKSHTLAWIGAYALILAVVGLVIAGCVR